MILIILLIIGSILNILRIFGTNLWADEIFSYELIQKSWIGIIEGTINDFHPPLYYLITKIFCIISDYSIVGYRMSSLCAILVLMLIGGCKIKKCFGKNESLVFLVCILIAPTMYYHVEIRMYSWALCFVTLLTIYSYQFLVGESKKELLGMIITGVLAAYTHYFALVVVALLYGSLFLIFIYKKDWKKISWMFCGVGVSILMYLPWIGIVLTQIENYGKSDIEIKSLFYYIKLLMGFVCLFSGTLRTVVNMPIFDIVLTVLGAVALAALLFFYFRKLPKGANEKNLFFMFVIVFVGMFFSGVLMDMLSHTFVARYFYPITGVIWILISLALVSLYKENNKYGMFMALLLIVLFIVDGVVVINQEYHDQKSHEMTLEFVNNNVDENDLLVTDYDLYAWIVLRHYFPNVNNLRYKANEFEKNIEEYEDIWFVHGKQVDSYNILNDYKWKEYLNSSLAENGCIIYKLEQ